MAGQSDSTSAIQSFFVLTTAASMLGGTVMAEAVVVLSPTLRSAYLTIPALSFFQFAFSGLFLKPVLLPAWLAPWAPSVSIIRWAMQAEFINQFQGSTVPPFMLVTPNYSAFNAFLSLFGWGGKTKWYCFYMVLVVVGVFSAAKLLAMGLSSSLSRGGRQFGGRG